MRTMNKLSELEGVTLGIILQAKSCTAYVIRKKLQASPSSQWRASAGAIYPLLTRLEDNCLIESLDDNQDKRGRKLLSITSKGKKLFKNWIKQIHEGDLIEKISDPLRSRIFFLDSLTTKEQLKFTNDALASLEEQLLIAKIHYETSDESDSKFGTLGKLGGIIYIKGRIEFLNAVLDKLIKDKP